MWASSLHSATTAALAAARAALLARPALAAALPPVASVWRPVALVAALNAIGWASSAALRTGHLFDLTGALSFLAAAGYSLALGPAAALPRQQLATAALALWAARLGSFLFSRVVRVGKDARLDAYVAAPGRFAFLFAVQTLWVSLGALPVLLLNSEPALAGAAGAADVPFAATALDAAGALLFAAGFALEVAADEQKRRFRADARNAGRFIATGLWGVVQHPNYLGEMMLQAGLALFCLPALLRAQQAAAAGGRAAPWALAALSPLFEVLLLRYVSGVPPLQRAGDEKWGRQPAYVAYRERTPLLLPWPLGAAPGPGAVKPAAAGGGKATTAAAAAAAAAATGAGGGGAAPSPTGSASRQRRPGAGDVYEASSRSRDASVRPATMASRAAAATAAKSN